MIVEHLQCFSTLMSHDSYLLCCVFKYATLTDRVVCIHLQWSHLCSKDDRRVDTCTQSSHIHTKFTQSSHIHRDFTHTYRVHTEFTHTHTARTTKHTYTQSSHIHTHTARTSKHTYIRCTWQPLHFHTVVRTIQADNHMCMRMYAYALKHISTGMSCTCI